MSTSPTRLLKPAEAAQRLGQSKNTLANWRCQRRNLPYVKLSAREVAYREQDIEAFISSRVVHPDESGR